MHQMELLIVKATKMILLLLSYLWIQLSEATGGIITRGFDQLFSIGLLLVVLFMLWKEYREGKKYNQRRDQELMQVIRDNTQERRDQRQTMHKMERTLEKIEQKI